MKNFHRGKRSQDLCISLIEERSNLCVDRDSSSQSTLKLTKDKHSVPIRELWNLSNRCVSWVEYPSNTRERKTRFKKVRKQSKRTMTVTDDFVSSLKHIAEENPEFYLDEIQMTACDSLKVCVPPSTTWKVLCRRN